MWVSCQQQKADSNCGQLNPSIKHQVNFKKLLYSLKVLRCCKARSHLIQPLDSKAITCAAQEKGSVQGAAGFRSAPLGEMSLIIGCESPGYHGSRGSWHSPAGLLVWGTFISQFSLRFGELRAAAKSHRAHQLTPRHQVWQEPSQGQVRFFLAFQRSHILRHLIPTIILVSVWRLVKRVW